MTNITRKTRRLFAALFVAALAAGGAHAQSAQEAQALIDEAEAARQQAAKAEFEWRWTKQYIKQAQEALAAGDAKKAAKLASRAKREGELAVEQAKTAARVWELALPK
jgi:hypothetical protein